MELFDSLEEVLSKVNEVDSSAFIAGGCLRDLHNYKPVKDIDIFFSTNSVDLDYLTILANQVAEKFNTTAELKEVSRYSNNTEDKRQILAVYSIVPTEGTPMELIFVPWKAKFTTYLNMMYHVDEFDINICQIGLCKDGMYMSDAYIEAVRTQTISVMNINRTDRGIKRLDRMAEKFPDWTINYPKELEDEIPF